MSPNHKLSLLAALFIILSAWLPFLLPIGLIFLALRIALVFQPHLAETDFRPRCPRCNSRHFHVVFRCQKMGFAPPFRFIRMTVYDYFCQEAGCKHRWSIGYRDRYDEED